MYVVGVDPAHQRRGLGGPVTRLGLAYLARFSLSEVELYVDGDNELALATYRRLGCTDAAIDVVLRPAQRSYSCHFPTQEIR